MPTKLVLGLDFETTGRDTSKDQIIEIGAVLWDCDNAMPLKIMSEMIYREDIWETATASKEKIKEITHIRYDHLQSYGISPITGLLQLFELMQLPDLLAVVAHNGNEFDKPLLYANAKKWNLEVPTINWIDTMIDIPYDPSIQTRKLTYLATEHNFMNPFAHRAIFDVLTMLKILQQYDIEWVLKLSQEPNVTLIANTTPPWEDGGKSNEEAKSRGYRFQSETKKWIKLVKESQIQVEKTSAPFSIREIR